MCHFVYTIASDEGIPRRLACGRRTCAFEQLINRTAATGKIVLCFGTMGMVSSEGAALAVYAGNGDGVIFANTISRKSSQDNFWPTVHVDLHQGTQILYYIRASRCFA